MRVCEGVTATLYLLISLFSLPLVHTDLVVEPVVSEVRDQLVRFVNNVFMKKAGNVVPKISLSLSFSFSLFASSLALSSLSPVCSSHYCLCLFFSLSLTRTLSAAAVEIKQMVPLTVGCSFRSHTLIASFYFLALSLYLIPLLGHLLLFSCFLYNA